jgi:hypothetical protein
VPYSRPKAPAGGAKAIYPGFIEPALASSGGRTNAKGGTLTTRLKLLNFTSLEPAGRLHAMMSAFE